MVEVKKNGQKQGKGNGEENVSDRNIPERNKPASICRWEEGSADR
jgi:hypothetical protein